MLSPPMFSKLISFKTALGLALVLVLGATAQPARSQTATFNFDADAFGTPTTFSDVSHGDTATFSSPADPGGFTVFPSLFTSLIGNVLIDNVLNANASIPLDIAFSRSSRSFSLNFAQNTIVSSPFTADFFYSGTLVGRATAFGAQVGPINSEGFLSFRCNALFNAVTLVSPKSTAFAVDNIQVDIAPVPESSTMTTFGLLLALGMGSLVLTVKKSSAT